MNEAGECGPPGEKIKVVGIRPVSLQGRTAFGRFAGEARFGLR